MKWEYSMRGTEFPISVIKKKKNNVIKRIHGFGYVKHWARFYPQYSFLAFVFLSRKAKRNNRK